MLKFAVRNLASRPMRSALSLTGLTVAIMGMTGLFSVAKGLDEMVSDTFGRITGLVAMQPGAPIPLFSRLPKSWEADIERIPGVRAVSADVQMRANIIDGKAIISPPRILFGMEIDKRLRMKQGVYRDDVIAGRFLKHSDRGTPNTVISRQIAEEFHKTVGDTLTVNGDPLKIVGIYDCKSLILDVAIIVDIGQLRKMSRFDADSVCSFYIETEESPASPEMAKRIQAEFRGRELPAWRPSSAESLGVGDFIAMFFQRLFEAIGGGSQPRSNAAKSALLPIEVRSSADWAERFEEFSADLELFLGIMSAIGVTIAVLSIVNTMLMSVSERIIEFGILKANGWSRRDVLRLIVAESALLGIGGGVCGCALGWIGTHAINATWPDRIHLVATPGLLLFGMAFSTVLGIAGGLYPAIWAMRMLPMEAIRRA